VLASAAAAAGAAAGGGVLAAGGVSCSCCYCSGEGVLHWLLLGTGELLQGVAACALWGCRYWLKQRLQDGCVHREPVAS
jgi:hypothetical protein